MKRVALTFWQYPDGSRTKTTRYRMSPEDAAERLPPGATPMLSDAIWINMAETPEEQHDIDLKNSTSAFLWRPTSK